MATATARAIRPDRYRDPASLLPTLPIDIGIGLFTSMPAEVGRQVSLIPIAFASAASPHIVQATHTNAKTKAYPQCFISPYSGRVSLPQSIDEL